MRTFAKLAVGVLGFAAMASGTAFAADHRDGAATKADPAADINDVFVWPIENGAKVNLAMTVSPFGATSMFSDATQYVFHVSSHAMFGGPPTSATDVICEFAADQTASCWIVNANGAVVKDYVTGMASATDGIRSADQKVRLFAGPRADPFFFYLTGFNATREFVKDNFATVAGLLNASGCPVIPMATLTVVQDTLTTTDQEDNDFKAGNVLVIELEVDSSLFTSAPGETLSVWAATHKK